MVMLCSLIIGHFVSAFVTHAFCNLMGMPDILEILNLPMRQRCLHLGLHAVGVTLWYLLLPPLTASCRFSTVIHYLPDLWGNIVSNWVWRLWYIVSLINYSFNLNAPCELDRYYALYLSQPNGVERIWRMVHSFVFSDSLTLERFTGVTHFYLSQPDDDEWT